MLEYHGKFDILVTQMHQAALPFLQKNAVSKLSNRRSTAEFGARCQGLETCERAITSLTVNAPRTPNFEVGFLERPT